MSPTPPHERQVTGFAQTFAVDWGLEVEPLRRYLAGQFERMAPDDLGDATAVQEHLTRAAIAFRDSRLRPILRDLFDWLRARLSHRLGASCHPYRDDAVSQAMALVLDYWKPWWSRPEGQEHLRRYAMRAAVHAALRILRGEKARESRLRLLDDALVQQGPELRSIEEHEERQRALAQSRLRDLDWLLQAGLTRVEAGAVVRFLQPSPTDGLDRRAEAAWRKALQRARLRLRSMTGRLQDDRVPGPRSGSATWCAVEYLGMRGHFEVAECSAGGLWLEGPVDDAWLEIGADCLVHIHSSSAVIARGARCTRIEQGDGRVRIALEFSYQARRLVDTQPTLSL